MKITNMNIKDLITHAEALWSEWVLVSKEIEQRYSIIGESIIAGEEE